MGLQSSRGSTVAKVSSSREDGKFSRLLTLGALQQLALDWKGLIFKKENENTLI